MSEYWQKRFEILEERRNNVAKQTIKSITPAFDQAQAQIEKEINAWYGRFAKNNEISLVEAKKLLNSRELKEFRWDVEEYIKYGRQNAMNQAWMKQLENASARFHISRLEALKIRCQNAAERAFGNELDQINEMAAQIYTVDYYHTAYEIQKGLGIGWDVGQIDERRLDNVLSKPWTADKQTFSDRIWKSKTQLIDSLHTELTQMCILGKAPDQAIKNITNRMNVSKGQAGRLVMTEAAYFGSVAQKDCFNDLGVEKYEIVATLDSHTSPICQEMDGKVFDMKDFQAGVTAPPFHCWCRSCTVPWFEDTEDVRAARDAEGKTYYVSADMKYEEWKSNFVDGGNKKEFQKVNMSLENDVNWGAKGKSITIEEYKMLRSYASERGIVLRGFKKSDIDIDLAKEFIDDSASMLEKYPVMKGDSKKPFTIELTRMHPQDFAVTYPGSSHVITLNANVMRDKEKLIAEYSKLASERWFVNGSDYHSIIYHEFGHLISDRLDIDGLMIAKSVLNTDDVDLVFEYLENHLSRYSISKLDGSEIISEMFSAYYQGINDEFILTFMKKCGII